MMNINDFIYGLKNAIDNSTISNFYCITRADGLSLYSDRTGIPKAAVNIEELITIRGTFYEVKTYIYHENGHAVNVKTLYMNDDGERVSERLALGI